MIRIAVVVGSVRPGRVTRAVADWALTVAAGRQDATYELVDLADHDLPLQGEAQPPRSGRYEHEHTRRWSARVAGFDGFLFVTPEYNHSAPAVLKNALDHLYDEWNDKAAGFVSLGFAGGVRAAEHLRGVAAELQLATVQAQLALTIGDDFAEYPAFAPTASREKELIRVLDQLERWAGALKTLRG
ncbi:NADPH-dependent FMN reductase [Streptomyces sp. NBC_00102]|uniref:NADPH-dependent FMN reductase n=1 Tax=Streptomyces sp. NBC_00102 TaxID=2975652 RepID=UPI00225935E1|nr:NAD(P)H-dependent oxidoreductase [Streptomyces sp. NBC_00102]MCX5399811.1 NAD(P)H-dependent oxidoreductase [Streptomyces sp. NBC_00102]